MNNYFKLSIRDATFLATNVVITGEDPHNLTESGIPKVLRYEMVANKQKQYVFDLPTHIRKWNIEYLSGCAWSTPAPESRGVLNLDDFPNGVYGDLNLHGVRNIVLTVYTKDMEKCGEITLMDAKA